jgi:transcriptional regulator with XRE-family HTH domain
MQVREVVGQRVREIREQAGVRQEDIATRARHFGLAWTRTRVASIERGGMPVTVENLLLLTRILGDVIGTPVDVAELFDLDAYVALSNIAVLPAREVAEVLHGNWDGDGITITDLPPDDPDPQPQPDADRRATALLKLLQVNPQAGDILAIRQSLGEADERAQRALGEDLGVYVLMCHGLWGRSIAAERDARLRTHTDASPASLAARRGRVTRELLTELRDLQGQVNAATETLGEHPAETGR